MFEPACGGTSLPKHFQSELLKSIEEALALNNLPPPISPNDRPLLHKIGEYVFQDLTVDLMANESDLRLAQLYGTRGQRQHGADAIADCTGGGMAVVQCKCYALLIASDVREACIEFERNLQHWKKQDARRFILVVACDATSTKVVDEVAKQRKHLKKKNIAFEVWDRSSIVQRLQRQRNLVHRYLVGSSTWVSILCGPQEKHPASLSANSSDAERQLLQSMLAEHAEKEVQNLREALRMGRRGEVRTRLKSFRGNSAKWALLNDRVQDAALRLDAALELDSTVDIQRAKMLISDAHRLDPDSSVVRLETRTRLLEYGPAKALESLPDRDDLETLCARGSILIHLGNNDEALRTLLAAKERYPNDADTLRLLAVAHLAQGEVDNALNVLSELVAVAPDWEIARHTKAVIFYVSALSSPRLQNPWGAFPEPVEWSFVRRDDESVRRLVEAGSIFETLLADPDRPRGDRHALEIWRLACMANDANRQSEAAAYCAKLVDQHPCNIYVLPWGLARGYPTNMNRVADISTLAIERNPQDLAAVLMAIAAKLQLKDGAAASTLLEQNRPAFEKRNQTEVWNYWRALIDLASGDSKRALGFIRSLPPSIHLFRLEISAVRSEALQTGDNGPLIERLSDIYAQTSDPWFLVELCNQYATSGNWTAVVERSAELMDKAPTPDSLCLAVFADFHTHKYERCLRGMEERRHWLSGSRLSLDFKRIRVACLERLGNVREALGEAEGRMPAQRRLFASPSCACGSGTCTEPPWPARIFFYEKISNQRTRSPWPKC
jgi:tetratricopeptide (TPR) repeat protein